MHLAVTKELEIANGSPTDSLTILGVTSLDPAFQAVKLQQTVRVCSLPAWHILGGFASHCVAVSDVEVQLTCT